MIEDKIREVLIDKFQIDMRDIFDKKVYKVPEAVKDILALVPVLTVKDVEKSLVWTTKYSGYNFELTIDSRATTEALNAKLKERMR